MLPLGTSTGEESPDFEAELNTVQQALCSEAPSLPTSASELGMAWLLPNSLFILEATAWL